MFPAQLFTHKYDIDDVIAALCGAEVMWLDSSCGAFSVAENMAVGEKYRHRVEPLPVSFVRGLLRDGEVRRLSAEEQLRLAEIVQGATVQDLPQFFDEGRVGGWLRERVKEVALEWLDGRDLIPPSMRHINRAKAQDLWESVGAGKVRIVGDT
ncbi:MAG: hypothetical protein EBR79_01570 [Proteobacteria bacterium]|nr:hypothetical protein [Pseudomonadota bacterium]NBX86498.1 hypothetical protein [Pseudomonadota bacterium]